MFDLRSLKYFVAAYEERSITGAAKRCFIAQPSITAAIQNLEATLDTQLFERAKSGLTPTADGEKLYPRAKALLAESAAIVKGFRQSPQQEIRLQLQDDVLISAAAPLIKLLYQEVPDARLRLTRPGEAYDLKLVAEHCRQENEWFHPLWTEDYVVLVPNNHPLRFKSQFELRDLHQAPFIERPYCVLAQMFAELLASRNIVPDVRATVAREEALLKLVELGLGIAVVPASHCKGIQEASVRRLSQDIAPERRMGLACGATDGDAIKLIQRLGSALKAHEKVARLRG